MSEGKKRRLWLLEPTLGDLCNCKMHRELLADASFPDDFYGMPASFADPFLALFCDFRLQVDLFLFVQSPLQSWRTKIYM